MRRRHHLLGALVVVAATTASAFVVHAVGTVSSAASVRQVADRTPPPPTTTAPPRSPFELLDLVNAERARNGLPVLAWSSEIERAAQRHSDDMAAHQLMQHAGSDGSNAGDRLHDAGFDWISWAENLGSGSPDPASLFNSWMSSAPHHKNILGNYLFAGAAVTRGANGVLYWTLDFASNYTR
jgi:uncharacterized protein YkwD